MPADAMNAMLAAQTHRRAMKSHTPADGIPWFAGAQYITVARDGRDAFMSWCNHVARMKMTALPNEQAEKEGLDKIPKFDGDHRGYFHEWLDANSYFEVVASRWAKRGAPNLLFVHYNDMKTDLEGQMRRVADFLEIELDDGQWPTLVERCTFEGLRKADTKIGNFEMGFEGGIEGFLFKGTNGRWRDVLGPDELAAYQRKVAECLPPDAARWIEHGGPID